MSAPGSAGASSAERLAAMTRASQGTLDRSILLFAGVVVVGAMVASPGADVVSVFGWEVPVMCGYRALTGESCFGCGLTRSFVFMAHARGWEAFEAHALGPAAFLLIAAQIPWRAAALWARRGAAEVTASRGGHGHASDQRGGGGAHS